MFGIKLWVLLAVGVLMVSTATGFGLWRYEVLNHSKTKDALSVATAVIKEHQENIIISERISNDYQTNINKLNADIKRLRNRPATCKCVTGTTTVHNGQGSGGKHGSENGIRSEWLIDYAIESEELRIERNSCKDFVNQVWESR